MPSYLFPAVREKEHNYTQNNTVKIYHVRNSDLDILSNGFIYQLMFFSQVFIYISKDFLFILKLILIIQAIFAKFIPCFLIVTFTSLLISLLVKVNKKNKKLHSIQRSSAQDKSYNNNNNEVYT